MKKWSGFEKGINLGGWLSQCDYSRERLEHFIEEEDIKRLGSWGIDHLRLPVDYNVLRTDDGDFREEGFRCVKRAVEWCRKYGLNIILDLHKTAGYSFDKDEQESGFFVEESCQEYFYTLWEEIARRFSGYGDHIAFELLNEVTEEKTMDAWKRISGECIRRIRVIAPTTKILIGGYWNNSAAAVKALPLPVDENIVYNFHCYEPLIFTHQGAGWVDTMPADYRMSFDNDMSVFLDNTKKYLPDNMILLEPAKDIDHALDQEFFEKLFAEAIAVAEERDVPLYCGEYGVIDLASSEDTVKWYQSIHAVFEKYHIGRAAWNYKEMNFGIIDHHMDPVRKEVIRLL